MGADFLADLAKLKTAREKEKAEKPPAFTKKEHPKVELTGDQKRIVIEYIMHAGKGIFEDVPEFWAGMSHDQIDAAYPAVREAVDKFVEECKHHLLVTIGEA